jgi:hypothetical protein
LHILVFITDIFIFTLRGRKLFSNIFNIILTLFLIEALAERIILVFVFVFSSSGISADLCSIVSGSEGNDIALA